MNSFYYKESSRENALQGIAVWLFVVPIGLAILVIFRNSHPTMLKFVDPIVVFISLFSAFYIYKIFKSKGDWEIYVNDSELIWQTPNGLSLLGENSFQVKLSQIKRIIGKKVKSLDETVIVYSLYLISGDEIELMTNSNVNLNELIQSLQGKGVEYEYKET